MPRFVGVLVILTSALLCVLPAGVTTSPGASQADRPKVADDIEQLLPPTVIRGISTADGARAWGVRYYTPAPGKPYPATFIERWRAISPAPQRLKRAEVDSLIAVLLDPHSYHIGHVWECSSCYSLRYDLQGQYATVPVFLGRDCCFVAFVRKDTVIHLDLSKQGMERLGAAIE